MIFAPHSIYDDLRANIVWYCQQADRLALEDRSDKLARAVLDTWHDLSPRHATESQVRAFNAACQRYRLGLPCLL